LGLVQVKKKESSFLAKEFELVIKIFLSQGSEMGTNQGTC
jgi:hypothetical protein